MSSAPRTREQPRTREGLARRATESPFRRRTAVLLAAFGGLGLALWLGFLVFGPDAESVGDGSSAGGHQSAVGYRTLLDFLRAEVPVEAALGRQPTGLDDWTPLLLLEPGRRLRPTLAETLDHANNHWAPIVLVLPKWQALPHQYRPGWAGEVHLVPADEPLSLAVEALEAILDSEEEYLDGEAENAAEELESAVDEERAGAEEWVANVARDRQLLEDVRQALATLAVVRPASLGQPLGEDWARGAELGTPQLLLDPSDTLLPVVGYREGMAIAALPNRPVYLVADPDLWNVAGLGRGENAWIARRLLVEELAAERILVKEGRHGGLRGERSLWQALLQPPLAWITLHVGLVALLAMWIAASRFGRPRVAAPRVLPGKRTLVENTARLLSEAGDPGSAVERYLGVIQERAADTLGLPAELPPRERLRRLEALGGQRGARDSLSELAAAVDDLPRRGAARRTRALELARQLYRWHRQAVRTTTTPGGAREGGS